MQKEKKREKKRKKEKKRRTDRERGGGGRKGRKRDRIPGEYLGWDAVAICFPRLMHTRRIAVTTSGNFTFNRRDRRRAIADSRDPLDRAVEMRFASTSPARSSPIIRRICIQRRAHDIRPPPLLPFFLSVRFAVIIPYRVLHPRNETVD